MTPPAQPKPKAPPRQKAISKPTPPAVAKSAASAPAPIPAPRVEAIRAALLAWFDEEHRPMPWRSAPSPYKTVVSEFMLQQTQVVTVIPYFERFTALFPSFEALAAAPEEQVLRAWSGLGYYRRARMLKRAAEAIVRQHQGSLPADPVALAALPGFGEYTVGAVGSIALGMRLPLVDGNVRRVIGRLFALKEDLTRAAGKRRLWQICETLVDPTRPGDFNQSLMELGATLCIPREPLCLACPAFALCEGRASGFPEAFPAQIKRPALKLVREVAVAVIRAGKLLVLQRGEGSSFAGMWELPRLDTRELEAKSLTPAEVVFTLTRLRPAGEPKLLGKTTSTFTNHKIQTDLYELKDKSTANIRRQRHVNHRWIALNKLEGLPISAAQRKLFELLRAGISV